MDTPKEVKPYEINIYESFEDLNLDENLLRGIYAMGFEKPSSIQQKAIKPFIDGKDVLAQSQSGTGKTATFSISLLQSIKQKNVTQAIVISHTRELANQIYNVMNGLSKYQKHRVCLLSGGTSVSNNIMELNNNPEIIVGTPGRIYDMLIKNFIDRRLIKYVIIDEADEMLSRGFINQIYEIFRSLNNNNLQVGLYSATMPNDFFDLSKKIMIDPVKILVKTEELTLEGIRQFYVNVEKPEFKFDVLCDLYDNLTVSQSIIYCNSKKIVKIIGDKLNRKDFPISIIHGEMEQSERNEIVNNFRKGEVRILLSTDLLARGIDVQQVSIVINFDIPSSIENYLHRIGRSGRFGRKGVAINLITNLDISKLKDIEKYYGTHIEELTNDYLDHIN